MSTPFVSVIVPALNVETTIGQCLQSILNQITPGWDYEIIVVDNGSNDQTAKVLDTFGERIGRLHVPHRNRSIARNSGIERAKGEFMAFIDADCTASQDWLVTLIEPLKTPATGITGGRIKTSGHSNAMLRFQQHIYDQEKAVNVYVPPYVISCNMASRRDILKQAGGFSPAFKRGEDVDLSWRIAKQGYRFSYVHDAIVNHLPSVSWFGLLRKGIQHGYASVAIRKAHSEYLIDHGCAINNFSSFKRAARALVNVVSQAEDRVTPMCHHLFESGKCLGRIAGSARFRCLDL